VTAAQSFFDIAVGWSNILAAFLAVVALVVALGLGTSRLQVAWLKRLRRRTIGRRVRAATAATTGSHRPTRKEFGAATSDLLRQRVDRGEVRVLDELTWLSRLFGGRQAEEQRDPSAATVPVPFSFTPDVVGSGSTLDDPRDYQSVMKDLAEGYAEYGAALRKRWILRSAAGPLVTDEYACATATAELIRRHSRYRILSDAVAPIPGDSLRREWLDMSARPMRIGRKESPFAPRVRLLAWPRMARTRGSVTFPSTAVSYQAFRVVEDKKPGHTTAPGTCELRVLERRKGDAEPEDAALYDGIMTRLHGKEGFRIEMDPHSGRQRLHLCVSETSFWAFTLSQWAETAEKRWPEDAGAARLLSVNLLLADDDDRILFVPRHAAVTHGGQIAGAVSGAAEIVSREGIDADVDPDGVPDLSRTFVREAKEELGIDLSDPEWKLGVLGLIEVIAPRDLNTHVLTGLARLPVPAPRFRVSRGSTDDVEGTWELGDEALVVDLKTALRTDRSLGDLVAWLRSADEVLPHAVGGLMLLVVARLQSRGAFEPKDGSASVDALERFLRSAPPEQPHPRPPTVTSQPLWSDPPGGRSAEA
jgi:8-oxo-dGTP pyrophosphatase MutT (NUDIX family)